MQPSVEVIRFGDEEGAAETAKELGLHHEPHVERTEFGTKRLDFMFSRAQAVARHDLLCYINCDILLMRDFVIPREERESLVVDDDPADHTATRLRKFGNALRYLYKANGGQASAFNYGFQDACGEVIAGWPITAFIGGMAPTQPRPTVTSFRFRAYPTAAKYLRHLLCCPWTYGRP